jgi:hypothetical protein
MQAWMWGYIHATQQNKPLYKGWLETSGKGFGESPMPIDFLHIVRLHSSPRHLGHRPKKQTEEHMRKIAKHLATAAAVGATLFFTTPSHAVTGPTLNPNAASANLYSFTLYRHADFGGCYSGADAPLRSGSLAGQVYGVLGCEISVNNTASSMRNDYAQNIYLYDAANCTGTIYVAKPHSEDSTFSNNEFNDKASCISY